MDYKEFEFMYCHMIIRANKEHTQLCFKYDVNDERQRYIVEKYKDISPEEFEKYWFHFREKYRYRQDQRAPLIAKFKTFNPTDFMEMSDSQKFKYLDALSEDERTVKNYEDDFSGIHENLQACLFSIKADKNFWIKEKAKANHFINALIGNNLADIIKNADERNSEQKKDDIYRFINLFCKVYETPQPEILFKNPQSQYSPYCSATPDGKSIQLVENFINKEMQWHDYSIVFHEMIHIYQNSLFAKDSERYKMFSPWYARLKLGTWYATQGNDDEKYKKAHEIYALLPNEAHAYGIQTSFAELFGKRILGKNNCYDLGKIDYRNIYFGWTRD